MWSGETHFFLALRGKCLMKLTDGPAWEGASKIISDPEKRAVWVRCPQVRFASARHKH